MFGSLLEKKENMLLSHCERIFGKVFTTRRRLEFTRKYIQKLILDASKIEI